ncbi:hypothetical protein BJY52DRAFT_1372180 [Lactarius psammicola]|nr:hypothetical protein BJY52DRAFT_1372180 [Lactarius psammicola]
MENIDMEADNMQRIEIFGSPFPKHGHKINYQLVNSLAAVGKRWQYPSTRASVVRAQIAVGVEHNLSCASLPQRHHMAIFTCSTTPDSVWFANEFATCNIFDVAQDPKSVFGVAALPEPRVPADILEGPEADRENPDRTITTWSRRNSPSSISQPVFPTHSTNLRNIRRRPPQASLFVTPTARLVPRGRHDRDCPHIRARARASEDQAPGVILERTVVGGEDAVEAGAGAERCWKKDERRASGALERPFSFDGVRTPSSDSLDGVVAAMFQYSRTYGRVLGIEEVIGGRSRASPYVGLKCMDEVLNELRAAASVDAGGP